MALAGDLLGGLGAHIEVWTPGLLRTDRVLNSCYPSPDPVRTSVGLRDVSIPTNARAGRICSADEKAHPPSPAGLPAAAASSITVLALLGVVMEGDIVNRTGSLRLSLPILRSVDWQGPQIVGGTVLTKLNILAYSLIVLANDADRPAGRSK